MHLKIVVLKCSCPRAEGLVRKGRGRVTLSLCLSQPLSTQCPGAVAILLETNMLSTQYGIIEARKTMGTKIARRRKKCEGKKTKQEPGMNYGREHAGGSPGARMAQPAPGQAAPEQGHTLALALCSS